MYFLIFLAVHGLINVHVSREFKKVDYEMARILVEHFGKDWSRFSSFVQSVVRDDAGHSAAHEALELDLGDCVCALLDLADTKTWSPNPAVWHL